jgi:uncharacterized protein YjiS (DUF1127 family)
MIKIVKKLQRYIQMRSRYNRTVSELSKLSNRDLADLGLARSDIERVAHRSVFALGSK